MLPKLDTLIHRGLRARLELESLVTGKLGVTLNFYPGTSIRLTGLSKDYPEVPTIPSSFEQLTRRLENLPLETLVAQTTQTMRSVEALATAPEVREAMTKADVILPVLRLSRTSGARWRCLVGEA